MFLDLFIYYSRSNAQMQWKACLKVGVIINIYLDITVNCAIVKVVIHFISTTLCWYRGV